MAVPAAPANSSESDQAQFELLMQTGRQAYAAGQHQRAHDLWREAALLNPYTEKVWIALLHVLDSDEDRIVCLENIVAINPTHVKAREQLRLLRRRQEQIAAPRAVVTTPPASRRRGGGLRRLILLVLALMAGAAAGIIASIIVYGL